MQSKSTEIWSKDPKKKFNLQSESVQSSAPERWHLYMSVCVCGACVCLKAMMTSIGDGDN